MRYTKQILFDKIGKKGQEKIQKSTVAIVGLGATGSASANLLARAGIGRLILIDRDVVELDNLQRQSLYDEKDVFLPKAICAREHLWNINSGVQIDCFVDDIDFENIEGLLGKPDLILDCTDNFETRFLINDYCVKNKIPFVYSGVLGGLGVVVFFSSKSPCFRCVFSTPTTLLETCDNFGVIGSAASAIASYQVTLAIRHIVGEKVNPELIYVDLWDTNIKKLKVNIKKDCVCCRKKNFEFLLGRKKKEVVKLCGKDSYHIRGNPVDIDLLYKNLRKIGETKRSNGVLIFNSDIIFSDGRAIIKAKDEKAAKTKYNKYVSG